MDKNRSVLHCELTELQSEYLPVIEWFIDTDSYRATGRTYLMAVAFIKMAMKRPGIRVNVWDHYFKDEQQGQHRIMNIVEVILRQEENEEILKRTKFYRDGFTINGVFPRKVEAAWNVMADLV